ncbi:hypothetical protein [Streptomyces niveus]|uniref:hypothetical protein n=1 Tax=Streptomyces niveus TaxID=193462 RepID=UPI0035DBCA90
MDRDTLKEAAEEALTRPSDAMFYDERLFDTHGLVWHWAEGSGDILAESNFHAALEAITGAAGDDAGEHVIDGSERHFALGYIRALYVQVYETFEEECECEPTWKHEDECGEDEESWYCENFCLVECDGEKCLPDEQAYTPAFVEAVKLALYLKGDGAILDDSDYSERENEAFEAAMKEAVEQAQREYTLVDTVEEDEAIAQRFYLDDSTTHRNQWCHPEDVSWETVAEEYGAARDAYFEELATEVYRWNVLGYSPDQLGLFSAA